MGIERALAAQARADVVLLVLDAAKGIGPEEEAQLRGLDGRGIVVWNKMDLTQAPCGGELSSPAPVAHVCAKTGEGVHALVALIEARAQAGSAGESQMTAQRHIACAQEALEAIGRAQEALFSGHPLDIASIDIAAALGALMAITGESAAEAVVDEIFARFCVGK